MIEAAVPLPEFEYDPPQEPIRWIHVDAALIAVDKPSGLLSVPGRGPKGMDCLIHRVQAVYPDALVVHRLDMSTSGLLLLARGPAMQRMLSLAFQARSVDKTYEAVVAGCIQEEAGLVDLPLICDWPNRPRQKVDHMIGKPSRTRYQRLAVEAALDRTRVRLFPETGRSHQLRVHMASLGHPILGDELYAGPAASRASRLLLHASTLSFTHPLSVEKMTLTAETPF